MNALLAEGTSATVTMDWPDNSIPKAAFAADITLAAPGETITFQSLSSQNTEKVTWTLTGADKESAEGETVSVTYAEEGVYAVSMKAENESGSSEASIDGYIVITQKASDGLSLLSQGAGTEADTYVNDNEAPQFAVDGDYTKKWCATGSAPHEITLDLGSVRTVSAVDVYHAEAGGESKDMNTKSYAIFVSEDGASFEEVRSVTRNTAGTTHDAFAPVKAQYVKLVVNKPTQGSDSAELGHIKCGSEKRRCTCGRYDCLEAYASATALIGDAKEMARQHPESMLWELCGHDLEAMNAKMPFDAADAGDACGKTLVENYISYLADGITDLANIFRPDIIVLGGGVCAQGEKLTNPLNRHLHGNCFGNAVTYIPQVVIAKNGNLAGLIGAAGLVYHQLSK